MSSAQLAEPMWCWLRNVSAHMTPTMLGEELLGAGGLIWGADFDIDQALAGCFLLRFSSLAGVECLCSLFQGTRQSDGTMSFVLPASAPERIVSLSDALPVPGPTTHAWAGHAQHATPAGWLGSDKAMKPNTPAGFFCSDNGMTPSEEYWAYYSGFNLAGGREDVNAIAGYQQAPVVAEHVALHMSIEQPCEVQAKADKSQRRDRGKRVLPVTSTGETSASNLTAEPWPDDATTVMLRNIPNRYTAEELLSEVIDEGFNSSFDFFYLPADFGTKRNRGYAFINFTAPDLARGFVEIFANRKLTRYSTQKTLDAVPAVTQGFDENVLNYTRKEAKSKRVHNPWFRPIIFRSICENEGIARDFHSVAGCSSSGLLLPPNARSLEPASMQLARNVSGAEDECDDETSAGAAAAAILQPDSGGGHQGGSDDSDEEYQRIIAAAMPDM